jgi:hypothetical protein
MDLGRKLATELCGHHALKILHDARHHGAVVVELFGTIGNLDAGLLADEFVVRALVGVLKASPSAHVVNQDVTVIGSPRLHVLEQLNQSGSVLQTKPALSGVTVRLDDRYLVQLRVGRDHGRLVLEGIALVVGGHPHVLRGAES